MIKIIALQKYLKDVEGKDRSVLVDSLCNGFEVIAEKQYIMKTNRLIEVGDFKFKRIKVYKYSTFKDYIVILDTGEVRLMDKGGLKAIRIMANSLKGEIFDSLLKNEVYDNIFNGETFARKLKDIEGQYVHFSRGKWDLRLGNINFLEKEEYERINYQMYEGDDIKEAMKILNLVNKTLLINFDEDIVLLLALASYGTGGLDYFNFIDF